CSGLKICFHSASDRATSNFSPPACASLRPNRFLAKAATPARLTPAKSAFRRDIILLSSIASLPRCPCAGRRTRAWDLGFRHAKDRIDRVIQPVISRLLPATDRPGAIPSRSPRSSRLALHFQAPPQLKLTTVPSLSYAHHPAQLPLLLPY